MSHLTSLFPSGAVSSSTDVFKIMKQEHALLTVLDASQRVYDSPSSEMHHCRLVCKLGKTPWLTAERKALEALGSLEIFHQVVL